MPCSTLSRSIYRGSRHVGATPPRTTYICIGATSIGQGQNNRRLIGHADVKSAMRNLWPTWGQNMGLPGPKPCASGGKGKGLNGTFDRGGGDRLHDLKIYSAAATGFVSLPLIRKTYNDLSMIRRTLRARKIPWVERHPGFVWVTVGAAELDTQICSRYCPFG